MSTTPAHKKGIYLLMRLVLFLFTSTLFFYYGKDIASCGTGVG